MNFKKQIEEMKIKKDKNFSQFNHSNLSGNFKII